MMGIGTCRYSQEVNRLGISEGLHSRGRCTPWDKEGFFSWWHGVDALPTPGIEKPTQEEPESFVEDDLPFEEPDPIPADDFLKFHAIPVPATATPCNGSMSFKCPADQALNTLAQLLGNTNCAISVMWRVIEEGSDEGV